MFKDFVSLALRSLVIVIAATASLQAAEKVVVLKAVSAFDPGSAYSRPFERFVDFVNAEGKGEIRIEYLGGGKKIMSVFEMGNALKSGVYDILNINSAFYSNLMPESNAIKLATQPVSEQRKNGAWAYLEKLAREKLNAYLLCQSKGQVPFHFYLRKGVKNIDRFEDLQGLKFRSTPIYQAFLVALGVRPIRMVPGDIYTGMERGVVDGYGWPIQGIDELGLVPVTGYRVDPGFFIGSDELFVNLDAWNKLSARQKEILTFAGKWVETWLPMYEAAENKEAERMQAEAGIKVIRFKGEEAKRYLEIGYKAAWEQVLSQNPSDGAELKQLLSPAGVAIPGLK